MSKLKIVASLIVVLFSVIVISQPAYAAPSSQDACTSPSFLGFPAWYNNLTEYDGTDCNVLSPAEVGGTDKFIYMVASNLIKAAMVATAYICSGFLLYGGFMYLTNQGSSDSAAKANKTMLNAVIGLVISIVAIAATNFMYSRLFTTASIKDLTALNVLNNILNTIYFAAGVVAVVMIIIAGIRLTMSAGNADTAKKAKNSIIYSAIGIVIMVAAFAITNFVIGRLN